MWWKNLAEVAGVNFLLVFLNFSRASLPGVAQCWQVPPGYGCIGFQWQFHLKNWGICRVWGRRSYRGTWSLLSVLLDLSRLYLIFNFII